MLRQLRSPKIKTVLWIGLAIFIIPSFVVFYGWGSGGSNNNSLGLDTAATLELKNVGKVEVNKRLYEEAKRQLRYTTRQYLTNEMNDQSNADNQIIDYISSDRFAIMDEAISLALLSDFATEQGIKQDVSGPLNDLKKNIPSENQRQQFVQRLAQQNMSIGQYLEEVSRGEFLGLAQQTMSLKSR
ncbi:MAG: SurA N-terminal domain-containing protein, partial [Candidatus Sumerlaeales bacterium]|nr:SurA N-terminal domain-containing protein [Candidatus Sumerlaeales bacterium]